MQALLNGRPRKQLADQIDRLDRILDSLADGFQEIVAQAAEDGARIGAQQILQEPAKNPTLQTLGTNSAKSVIAQPANTPTVFERLRVRLRQLRNLWGSVVAPHSHRLQQAWQSVLFTLQLA